MLILVNVTYEIKLNISAESTNFLGRMMSVVSHLSSVLYMELLNVFFEAWLELVVREKTAPLIVDR